MAHNGAAPTIQGPYEEVCRQFAEGLRASTSLAQTGTACV